MPSTVAEYARHALLRLCFVAAVAVPAVHALAQQQPAPPSLPGLIVSVPPTPQPAPQPAPPQPAPTAATPPAAGAATAKPKPKPAAASIEKKPVASQPAKSGGHQTVVAFVNDEPITAYDVEQRSRLLALSQNIGQQAQENMKRLVQSEATQATFRAQMEEIIRANQGSKTREQIMAIIEQRKQQFAQTLQQQALESARASVIPAMKKSALEELIEERIKLQEAKRINVTVEEAQVDNVVKGIAERNKVTMDQFAQNMKNMGADITTMRSRFRATLAWNEVIRRRFTAHINISQREVDKFIEKVPEAEDQVEMHLHRITLAVPGKLDQRVLAQRFEEADKIRGEFGGCKSSAALATKLQNAKFEDLGIRKPSAVAEPTRTLLLNAKDGEMVPPSMAAGGVELYALCARKLIKADEQKRAMAQNELQQKEFEVLARRHLRDLRQDAHIEYR